jgi:hypothetical protein
LYGGVIVQDNNKFIKTCIAIAILMVGCSVSYYFVFLIPQQQTKILALKNAELEMEKKKEADKVAANNIQQITKDAAVSNAETDKENCLQYASVNYSANWENSCKTLGLKKDCSLPSYSADRWDKFKEDQDNKCLEEYRLKLETIK